MARGRINEVSKTTVLLNGQQAQQELKKLSDRAEEFGRKKRQAFETNDLTAYQKWGKELDQVNKQMKSMKQETMDVESVLKNLNGVSMNEIRRAATQATVELKKMRQTDPGYTEKQQQVKALNDRYKELSSGLRSANASSGLFNASMLKSMLPIVSVTGAIAGATRIVKDLLKLSTIMEGDSRRAAIVFGDSLGYVEKQAGELSKKMGLTNREFVAAATNTADLLIPLDFSREKAAQMAVQLQSLSGALDEWTGGKMGAQEVSQILTKAMLGETEQLKQMGIAIRKDSDEFKNLVSTKLASGSATKAQAEAEAMLQLIYLKSTDAQTAYNTEGNKLLRLQKDISRFWRESKESVVAYFSENSEDKIRKEGRQVAALVGRLTDLNTSSDERFAILEKLKAISPDIVANLEAENIKSEELATNLVKYNDALAHRIVLEKLTKEENEAMSKVAEKRANASMNEIRMWEIIGELHPEILSQQGTIAEKVQATIDHYSKLGITAENAGRTMHMAGAGQINVATQQEKLLDDLVNTLSKYNRNLEAAGTLEANANPIKERVRIFKEILGISEQIAGGNTTKVIPEQDRIKKFIEANKIAFDQMKLNSEQRLHILELTNRELENVQSVITKMPEEDRSQPSVDLTFMERLFEEGKADILKRRSENLITQQQYNEEIQNLEIAHLMTMLQLRTKLGVDTLEVENRLAQIKMENLNNIGAKEIEGFEIEKAMLAEKYANSIISKEVYNEELQNLEANHLQRLQEMYVFFGLSTTDLDRQITESKIKNLEEVETRTNAANTKMLGYYMNFVETGAQALQDFVGGNEDALKKGAKSMIFILLDLLKAQMQIAAAGATIQSLVQPDSIATFGVTGLIRAGIIVTLIEGAFAIAKGGISGLIDGFEDGGYTPGF